MNQPWCELLAQPPSGTHITEILFCLFSLLLHEYYGMLGSCCVQSPWAIDEEFPGSPSIHLELLWEGAWSQLHRPKPLNAHLTWDIRLILLMLIGLLACLSALLNCCLINSNSKRTCLRRELQGLQCGLPYLAVTFAGPWKSIFPPLIFSPSLCKPHLGSNFQRTALFWMWNEESPRWLTGVPFTACAMNSSVPAALGWCISGKWCENFRSRSQEQDHLQGDSLS